MSDMLAGTEEIIKDSLKLRPDQQLKHKSVTRGLTIREKDQQDIISLVPKLYHCIAGNWKGRSPSAKNWKLRRETSLSGHNPSKEVLLERAIVILAERGILEGWYNQLPTASGLVDAFIHKRAAVDWVYMKDRHASLVELKWDSDTGLFAAFEILTYGLLYLFSYLHREAFGYQKDSIMQVETLKLQVLAPADFYQETHLHGLEIALDEGLKKLFMDETQGEINASFAFTQFPDGFTLPFTHGEEVSLLATVPETDPAIVCLKEAMRNISPVWEG